ncbi:MAG: polysaccharide biosynthesis tyrosine autokinase [Methylovirgula sp.]
MLQIAKAGPNPPLDEDVHGQGPSLTEMFNSLAGIVRRQLPLFAILVACSATLGLLYLFTTPSSYTAKATMVIDTHKVQLFQQQQSLLGDIPIDAGTVLTQVEVLKSQNISLSVIKDLHLIDDPEFTGGGSGLIGAILNSIKNLFDRSDATRSEVSLQRRALGVFESDRTVNRVGSTYVMEVGFRSHDPDKAARIANAIVDAYIVDQLEAKYQATRRASVWLQQRIKELRTQASAADRAVVDFKRANNIVNTGGRLMNEQSLTAVNSQLILAHAATAEAKARLSNIQEIMKQAIPDGSVADSLKNEVIIKLRSQYLELASREALWSAKYGSNHLATIGLRNQMLQIRRSISDEMKKIAESYQSDYEIAMTRENAIRTSLAATVSESQVTNQAEIQLRELESNSKTYSAMYSSFLQRYMEAVQQQSFPITEARLISSARRPFGRSQPNTLIVLAVTFAGGMMLSFGVAFIREMADRVFRTGSQVENILQLNCLAMLPAVELPGTGPIDHGTFLSRFATLLQPTPLSTIGPLGPPTASGRGKPLGQSSSPTKAPPLHSATKPAAGSREIATTPGLLRYVVDSPFSQFTEALRSVKVATDLNGVVQANKVIGITSSLPNEGKSTIAANFAELIAHAGGKVILVDADLRNPSVSRRLAPGAEIGFVDVLAGRANLEAALWTDSSSGLHFLPAGSTSKLMHTNEILGSDGVKKLFDRLRETYDYVIVDFAPLAPVVDTRTTTNFIDSYVYVIEWGRTKIDVAQHSLSAAPEVYDRILGVVMNKADMSVLGRYERYRSNYYYRKYYSRYGYTA